MKIEMFKDFGLMLTKRTVTEKLTPSYLSGSDMSLLGMTPATWVLVLSGYVLIEGVDVDDTFDEIKKSIEKNNVNTGKVFKLEKNKEGLCPIEHLAIFSGKEKPEWSVFEIIKRLYTKDEVIEQIKTSSNTYNVNIYNIFLQYDMYDEFLSLSNWINDVKLLQTREHLTSPDQASPMFMLLKRSMDIRNDGKRNLFELLLSDINLGYKDLIGTGGVEYSEDSSVSSDDLIRFVLSSSATDIKKVCNEDNTVLKNILEMDLKNGESDVYNTALNNSLHTGRTRTIGGNVINLFPEISESFFSPEALIKRNKEGKIKQLTSVPALSYYVYKFKNNSDLQVMRFLLKATLPNAMCIKDDVVGGISPLAIVGEELKIKNGTWNSLALSSFYKEMLSSIGETPGDLYMRAGERYRMSEKTNRDLSGGMSTVLVKICKWSAEDEKNDISLLVDKVFPPFVTKKDVLEWGRIYGIIADSKQ